MASHLGSHLSINGSRNVAESLSDYAERNAIEDADDQRLIEELQSRGHQVELHPRTGGEGFKHIRADEPQGSVRFGVVSDTHLGSKHQQLTYLHQFYDYAMNEGVEFFLHAGDIVDGLHTVHRGAMVYEQFVHGFDAQVAYAAEVYPKVGVPTYIINGNHDLWFHTNTGSNVAKTLADMRDDMEYLGDEGAYYKIGDAVEVYVMHPAGGPAYARSYKLQKWIEQVPPHQKPHLALLGNWHISAMLPSYRNVIGALVPCFQAQTPYERRKGLNPEVGGYVIDIDWDEKGPIGMKFDSRFYRVHIENDY